MTSGGRTSSDHNQARAAGGGFDYNLVPIERRQEIKKAARFVRLQLQLPQPDAVAVGRNLEMVKRLLAHGTFVAWLEAELGMADGAAVRYIAAAARRVR